MKSQNHKEAFEQFLTDETNKHTMFASDAVWANINKQVQTQKRWPALTVIAFLIVVGLSVATALNYPPDYIITKAHYNDSVQLQNHLMQAAIIASKLKDDNFEDRISSKKITEKTFAAIVEQQQISVTIADTEEEKTKDLKPIATLKISKTVVAKNTTIRIELLPVKKIETLPGVKIVPVDIVAVTTNEPDKNVIETNDTKEATDNIYKDFYASRLVKKRSARPSKWSYDIYATPSQSFRKLEDDKERDQYTTNTTGSNIVTAPTASLGNTVKHKPALGLEAGISIGYNLTNRLKFEAGLQFNIRQYYIDAYQTFGIATVAIVQNNRLDSLNFYSRFGSAGSSYAETKLDNRLYQLSLPLGVQWDALQIKHFGISIGASVQPTVTLNKNVFLISTDYKYYANGESFFRKFNVNTALDVNFTYKLKKAKIYLGPQVRYQHLPTYNDAYPIKEYRMDYGIKVGIIKSF